MPRCSLPLTTESIGTEWKVFCMPAKHVDVGFNYLPAEAQEEGYPGSVEDFHNIITIRR